MRTQRILKFSGRTLGTLVVGIFAWSVATGWRGAAQAGATGSRSPGASTRLAFIATRHGVATRESEIRFITVGGASPSSDVTVALPHAASAVVRGDLLPTGRAAVIVADDEGGRTDFSSTLWLVDASTRAARPLAHGVYHASRPLASIDGRVYVERGTEGPAPTEDEAHSGALREDRLVVDAIDPASGAARTLMAAEGYTLHLAGELGRELVVYRVDRRGADLVAIDRGTGKSRLVTTLPPFARDFAVDAARTAVLLSNRDDHDTHLWVVERVDLATGARTRLTSTRDKNPPRDLGEAASLRLGNADERIELVGIEGGSGPVR